MGCEHVHRSHPAGRSNRIDTDRPLRVGIWAAVSSKEQATQDKISLESQEAQGRAFAEELGAEIVAVYRVPGHSRDLVLWTEAEATMPAYRQLREDLEAGLLDLLWALDIDRLGRDPALSSQVQSLAERHGAEVYTETAPHQVGHQTIGHRYVTAIQAVRAKEDTARRVKNWYMGMENRARRGLPHRWPHGYTPTRDPRTGAPTGAIFDPDKIAAVRLITELFLSGYPYARIARELNNSPHRPPRCSQWSKETVRRIVLCDTYAGLIQWHETAAEEVSPFVPALWDPETHRAIVRERARRKKAWTRKGGSPLAGVAVCGHCGARMHRASSDKERPKLRCSTHAARHLTGIDCRPNRIPEAHAIAAISKFITELTPERIAAAVRQDDPAAGLRAELEDLKATIQRLQAQRARIALDRAEGIMLPDAYRLADDSILDRLERAQDQAEETRARIAASPDPAARAAHLQELAANFDEDLKTKPANSLAASLQNAGLVVWIESGAVSFVGFRE